MPGSMTACVPKKSAASRIWCGMIMASFLLPSTKTGGSSTAPSTGSWWRHVVRFDRQALGRRLDQLVIPADASWSAIPVHEPRIRWANARISDEWETGGGRTWQNPLPGGRERTACLSQGRRGRGAAPACTCAPLSRETEAHENTLGSVEHATLKLTKRRAPPALGCPARGTTAGWGINFLGPALVSSAQPDSGGS